MNTAIAQTQLARRSETIRRMILRIHSVVLMLVALASTTNAIAGHLGGSGVYGFLRDNPLAYVGLHQAYLLMLVVAITVWFGAAEANTLENRLGCSKLHSPRDRKNMAVFLRTDDALR